MVLDYFFPKRAQRRTLRKRDKEKMKKDVAFLHKIQIQVDDKYKHLLEAGPVYTDADKDDIMNKYLKRLSNRYFKNDNYKFMFTSKNEYGIKTTNYNRIIVVQGDVPNHNIPKNINSKIDPPEQTRQAQALKKPFVIGIPDSFNYKTRSTRSKRYSTRASSNNTLTAKKAPRTKSILPKPTRAETNAILDEAMTTSSKKKSRSNSRRSRN